MATSEYYTGVQDFVTGAEGIADAYYAGADDTLLGRDAASGGFIASALFSIRGSATGAVQTIWANRDGAPGNGWEIRYDGVTREIVCAFEGALGEVSIGAVPDTNNIHTPMLVMLILLPGPTFIMVINDTVVSSIVPGGAYQPPAGSGPTVGARNSNAPAQGAADCVVHGVAYTDDTSIFAGATFYLNCRQGKDMRGVSDVDPTLDFQNRWSAQQDNYQPGAGAVGVASWAPRAGTLNLTRNGSPTLRAFKDLDWRGSFDTVNVVNPQPV